MGRNIQYQFQASIENSFKPGMDKKAIKEDQGRGKSDKIFSYANRKDMVQTAANFAHWLKANHAELRLASEVKTEHVNAYLQDKLESGKCTAATVGQYGIRLEKLQECINNNFKSANVDWKVERLSDKTVQYRNIAFERKDLDKVLSGKDNCASKIGVELAARFGLRADEPCRMHGRDINLKSNELHVVGKGGRERDLKIEEKDRDFMEKLKENLKDNDRVCPVQSDSINRYIGRACEKAGITVYKDHKTGVHAIRKMAAQERYDRLRNEGMTKEQALGDVNVWLGHSDNREDLSEVYVLNQW